MREQKYSLVNKYAGKWVDIHDIYRKNAFDIHNLWEEPN